LGVTDRTMLVMEATKVLTKKQLTKNAQGFNNSVVKGGRTFRKRFKLLIKKGIPTFWGEDSGLLK